MLTLPASSQAIWVPASGGLGALLFSPFNVIGDSLCTLEVCLGKSFLFVYVQPFLCQGLKKDLIPEDDYFNVVINLVY
jgi:hypothetical protein